ncbi:DUF6950 family protein [Arsenophonus nasoniae]|uniref:DUF6950 domain-containing protein n=1 Tax=Arsenophonus nasoniae TaxID=638 RepID=A0AA95GKP2_9GAMM|nr:hypothetical protein [Arsenophonus nasoniae]WGL93747.1 hypothetical protein QE207_00345 [Arsenophonus nasoniae]WGL96041.1 hypothetical protein QE207_05500 [Arsenophonus nasoniae]
MRHKDWVIRLPKTLRAAMGRPFSWGEHDCCLFVADCVIAVCDFDPCATIRGRYNSKIGALRVLKSEFGTLEDALNRFFTVAQNARHRRGDIVMFDGDDGLTLGVLWANKIWAVTDDGVRPVNKTQIMSWRVE